jgi:hypothetical protein
MKSAKSIFKKSYHRILFPTIISTLLLSCKQNTDKNLPIYLQVPEHIVGEIIYDAELDTGDFRPCHEDQVVPYYYFDEPIQYEGEKPALVKAWKEGFKSADPTLNTYVTILFVVNCEGETGFFRLSAYKEDLIEYDLDPDIRNELLTIAKSLPGWQVGEGRDFNLDYVQYTTLKIENGLITEVLP